MKQHHCKGSMCQTCLRRTALFLHARHQGISGRRQGGEVQRPPAGCPRAIVALPELWREGPAQLNKGQGVPCGH